MADLPRNATEAIGMRLLSDPAIVEKAHGNVSPNKPTMEANGTTRPYVYFFRLGGGGNADLAGACGLQRYLYRVAVLATSDEEADALHAMCRDRLVGNRKKNLAPWRDPASGVQGCFPADDNDADTDDDGEQFAGQTFALHFCPQV